MPAEKNEKNFEIFGPPSGIPGVPHIWAHRSNIQKSLGYYSSYTLRGSHAKFHPIRPSRSSDRGGGYKKAA